MSVTALALGGTAIGGMFDRNDDETGAATVQRGWDCGVRYFDTAPYYGHGASERRLGQALRTKPRAEFVLSTKVGRLLVRDDTPPHRDNPQKPPHWQDGEPYRAVFDYSRDAVLRSLDTSRERLGIDRFDIVYIHDAHDHVKQALDGAYPALDELRSAGVVRAIGAGINWTAPCLELARSADFDCFLLANQYTLLEQAPLDELFPLCAKREIGIVAGGCFSSGILATGAVEGAHYRYKPASPEILDRVAALESICARHGVSLPAAALQFPAAHPVVAAVVVGARTPEEIAASALYLSEPVPEEFWRALKSGGFLREDAPTPNADS